MFIAAVAAHRPAQRAHRGDLHRPRAGQGLRPAGARSSEPFAEENDELYEASLRRAVRLRADHAGDDVHREPQLRRDRGPRRPPGRQRRRCRLGEVQAFIQYSRQFTQPLTQVASMVNLLQSGVASAERVFELLDAEEEPLEPRRAARRRRRRGEVRVRARVVPLRPGPAADRGPVAGRRARARPSRSSARPVPARPRWSTW